MCSAPEKSAFAGILLKSNFEQLCNERYGTGAKQRLCENFGNKVGEQMKKLGVLLLSLLCAGGLTACGASPAAAEGASSAVAVVGSSVTSSTPVQSTHTPARTADALPQRMVLGIDAAFPPMGFTNEKNDIVGVDIDLAKAVCEKLELEFEVKPIAWDAKEKELNTGTINCIWNGFSVTDENRTAFEWSRPYMKNTQRIVVLNGSPIKGKADLAGKHVAVQKASSALLVLQRDPICAKIAGAEPKQYENYVLALTDLENGVCDAVVIDSIVANYYIAQNKKAMTVLSEEMGTEEYSVAFEKGDTVFRDAVEEALLQLEEEGEVAKISQKWFGVDDMIAVQ